MEANHPEAVTVTIGGRERVVKLSIGALDIAANRHGHTFSMGALARVDYALLPRLVWAGFLEDDPDLDFAEVAAWMDADPEGAAEAAGAALAGFARLSPLLKALRALKGFSIDGEKAVKNGKAGKAKAPEGA